MTKVIGVRFKANGKSYYFSPGDLELQQGDYVIVETARGTECGEVPSDMDDLIKLPGVGRKTANVMLAVVWGKAAMAVDTHVFRVSERIGLTTNSKNPLQTEKQLCKYIPEDIIPLAHHWLILHGRYVCKARRPDCLNCGLTGVCRYYRRDNKETTNNEI